MPPKRILMVCLGIDIGNQRARRFIAADFQRFDKVYAMAGEAADRIIAKYGQPGAAETARPKVKKSDP